ncbi:hypothetical protein [Spiroplasma clarkii]|nr:hypothetical protein [Spiroplasma clarkii]
MAFTAAIFLALSATIVTVVMIVVPHTNNSFHYEFDGRRFNTK